METISTAGSRWEPVTVAEVQWLMAPYDFPWWIAGGNAIDLAVGHSFRPHGDIDVLVPRRAQLKLRAKMPKWQWWAARQTGTLSPWDSGEELDASVHDIWCRPHPDGAWKIQFMLDEVGDDEWVSRRDPGVRLPLEQFGRRSTSGVPYIAPHVQLYYKGRNTRPKDRVDFDYTEHHLTAEEKQWLRAALASTYGDHEWLARLAS